MVLFIRNNQGRTIADVEVFKKKRDNDEWMIDVSSTIITRSYSEFLMKSLLIRHIKPTEVVNDFEEISELRGWTHEVYLQNNPDATKQDVINELRDKLKAIADKYNLKYVED